MNDVEMFIACCENPLKINIVSVDAWTDHITDLIQTHWISTEDEMCDFIYLFDLEKYLVHSFGVSNTTWKGYPVIEVNIYRKEQ